MQHSIIDYIILLTGTIILPGLLYTLAFLYFAGDYFKKDKKTAENKSNDKEAVIDNKEAELGYNRIDYRFTASPSIQKIIDGYEKKV